MLIKLSSEVTCSFFTANQQIFSKSLYSLVIQKAFQS